MRKVDITIHIICDYCEKNIGSHTKEEQFLCLPPKVSQSLDIFPERDFCRDCVQELWGMKLKDIPRGLFHPPTIESQAVPHSYLLRNAWNGIEAKSNSQN